MESGPRRTSGPLAASGCWASLAVAVAGWHDKTRPRTRHVLPRHPWGAITCPLARPRRARRHESEHKGWRTFVDGLIIEQDKVPELHGVRALFCSREQALSELPRFLFHFTSRPNASIQVTPFHHVGSKASASNHCSPTSGLAGRALRGPAPGANTDASTPALVISAAR